MESILSKNNAAKKEVILISDLNINLLDLIKINKLMNFMFRFRMIPTINRPTRVTRYTVTAIDHVFINTINGQYRN